jgi:hypothetical protein
MVIDLLFILCIFIIYSHNITKLNIYEVLIRIVLFGISIKYFYSIEPFKVNCYPESVETSAYESYDSDSKGWCDDRSDLDRDSGSGDFSQSDSRNSGFNSDECILGREASASRSAASNSKSWCIARERY